MVGNQLQIIWSNLIPMGLVRIIINLSMVMLFVIQGVNE